MRRYCCPRTYFYPRPPRGGRLGVIGQYGHRLIFLSTPSARRATPRGEETLRSERQISIHALREEGDTAGGIITDKRVEFLSTPSARRATKFQIERKHKMKISIHALREEGDLVTFADTSIRLYFYPRPPRGGRRVFFKYRRPANYFYPRPPRGGRQGSCRVLPH